MKNGDVVITTCAGLPLCVHPAFVVEEYGQLWLYNNTPSASNEFGGNVVRQSPSEFFQKRKIIEVRPLAFDAEWVRKVSWELRFEKWHALKFNCEDYVSEVLTCCRNSQLRQKWVVGSLAALAVLMYYGGKKKRK